MAIACPVDLDTLRLRAEIQSVYGRVATEPSGSFHFHRGPAYAAEMLGYDAKALATLPAPRNRVLSASILTRANRRKTDVRVQHHEHHCSPGRSRRTPGVVRFMRRFGTYLANGNKSVLSTFAADTAACANLPSLGWAIAHLRLRCRTDASTVVGQPELRVDPPRLHEELALRALR